MSTPIVPVARELANRGVRYVLVGVSGAKLWAAPGQGQFVTSDFNFFLPLDVANLVSDSNRERRDSSCGSWASR